MRKLLLFVVLLVLVPVSSWGDSRRVPSGGGVGTLGAIGDICDANEIIERNAGDTAWGCISTPSGVGADAITVDEAPTTDPNFSSVADVGFVVCTGAGAPDGRCLAENDVVVDILDGPSHKHTLFDLYSASGDFTSCTDVFSIPIPVALGGPGGDQTSGSADSYCDSQTAAPGFRDSSRTLAFTDSSWTWDFTNSAATSKRLTIRSFALDGASGSQDAFRVELDVEDLDVFTDSPDLNLTSAALKVSVTPSSVNFPYPNVIVTRNEEDVGVNASAYRHIVTKQTGVTTNALNMSHPNIVNALDIGENNLVTTCSDVFELAQTTGSADGIADRDGLTALCTDLFDDVGVPQTTGSPDTFCDSDGTTPVEYDENDTGTLPQSGCIGAYTDADGCPDTFCDGDGATAWPDRETFSAAGIESVFLGDSVDNADAQHTHDLTTTGGGTSIIASAGGLATRSFSGASFEQTGDVFDLTDAIARDQEVTDDIATHAAIASAHHTKTISASELSTGTIPAARVGAAHIDALTEIVLCAGEASPQGIQFAATTGAASCKDAVQTTIGAVNDGDILVGVAGTGDYRDVQMGGDATMDETGLVTLAVGAVDAGGYAAGSIDGDDIASGLANRSLTLTPGSPDVLDADEELYRDECNITFETAVATDDIMCGKATGGLTLIGLDCVATGSTTPSAHLVTVVECTSAGASCTSVGLTASVSALVTNVSDTDFTGGDSAVADGAWWGIETTSLTTAADFLHCQVEFTRDD